MHRERNEEIGRETRDATDGHSSRVLCRRGSVGKWSSGERRLSNRGLRECHGIKSVKPAIKRFAHALACPISRCAYRELVTTKCSRANNRSQKISRGKCTRSQVSKGTRVPTRYPGSQNLRQLLRSWVNFVFFSDIISTESFHASIRE